MPVKNIYKMWSEIHFAKALAWFAIGMAVGGPSCWPSWVCFAGAIFGLIRSIMMYVVADEEDA
jgi:hypothetical protein